ncbi:L-alanine-DL-glutamate epimerase-like enolase superfamily enzyme [Lewinella marina]|uniref:Dipeptide epimerase n=1 Tax=Neolewinella marina TaxID=438751 RepID=A0A2G0CHP6_9BACT|nr:dipeptide epimerase [Neolewinella marina]NJB85397.1 L-alanine-DL-glutamate epimerase-like enolase superfamily enzyme [Neolewinella marina]PHK99491.1 dipeptide epimerase [Neolewinella marina]
MRITHIEYERYDLELIEPYTIAYETIGKATNFALRLVTDTGIVGYGCAAPDVAVTNERPEDVERAISESIVPALTNAKPFHYARLVEELRPQVRSSALAMVDNALYDLVAKAAGVPLYQFLGGYRNRIATSITIGILPLKETMVKAREFVSQGFGIIKIKGGLDVEEDISRVRMVRKEFPDIRLRFDGNQGYTLEQALHFIGAAQLLGVDILEQPTSINEEAVMGTLTRDSPIAVMADESLKTLADAFRLTQHELTDMINIKLQKVGGIWPALHINSVAKSAANDVMVGCLDECGLGIGAGLHFALSRPNIAYADLDGHLDFKVDPFSHLFHLDRGVLIPNGLPGLGT